jgi:hypothetical protein
MDRLSSYPWVIVRIACDRCKRRGSYRLARLAAKFGPEAPMDYVLDKVAFDCPARGDRRGRRREDENICHARFIDLDHPAPPDLPPAIGLPVRKLRLVAGGKRDR